MRLTDRQTQRLTDQQTGRKKKKKKIAKQGNKAFEA